PEPDETNPIAPDDPAPPLDPGAETKPITPEAPAPAVGALDETNPTTLDDPAARRGGTAHRDEAPAAATPRAPGRRDEGHRAQAARSVGRGPAPAPPPAPAPRPLDETTPSPEPAPPPAAAAPSDGPRPVPELILRMKEEMDRRNAAGEFFPPSMGPNAIFAAL